MATSPLAARTEKILYEFDAFRVDPVRRRLLRSGEQVPLTPKAFSILMVLLENRGEVVEKEALIRRVWPDAYVTEANLTQNISALRKALGERANDHRYVVTVPGLGYSFVAEVLEVPRESSGEVALAGPAPAAAPVSPPAAGPDLPAVDGTTESEASRLSHPGPAVAPAVPATKPLRSPRGPLLVGLALGFMLALVAIGFFLLYRDGRSADAELPAEEAGAGRPAVRPAVAVLALRNLSGDPQDAWLSIAFSEMLITELSAGSRARMISGEEIARLRNALALSADTDLGTEHLRQIHELLGTDMVVMGSYLALYPKIRIDLRVLKAPEGETVASLAEVGTEDNLFELVTLVGQRLRRTLRWAEPSPAEAKAVQALQPANQDAARLYAEGLTRLRAFDSQGARNLLRQAAAADPGSAVVRSALSLAWIGLGYDAQAREEAEKAVRLAQTLPKEERLAIEARFSEAKKDWAKASEIYRSLWTFYPDNPEYGLRLANALSSAGRGAEALATVAGLRRLPPPTGEDPRIDLAEAQIAKRLANLGLQLRAAKAAERKGRTSGGSQVLAEALMLQGDGLLLSGRPQDSIPLYGEARELFARTGDLSALAVLLTHFGVALHEQGDLAEAERMYQESLASLSRIGSIQGVATQLANLGLLYRDRGDMPQAQELLEKARASYVASGDRVLGARSLNALGTVLAARGDLAGARRRFEESLTIARQTGNRIDQARALRNLGMDLARKDSLKEALRLHERAYDLTRQVGDPVRGASMLAASAEDLVRLGNLPEARRRLTRALEMKRQGHDKIGTGEVLSLLARLHYRLGNLAEAERLSREQLALARRTGAHGLAAMALGDSGRWSLERGDLTAARRQLEEALQSYVANGETLAAMAARIELAGVARLEGNTKEAMRLATEAGDWYGRRGMDGQRARALALLSQTYLAEGLTTQAWETATQAHAISEQSEDLELQLAVVTAMAPAGVAAGQRAAALSHLQWAIAEAARIGDVAAWLEARLCLGTLQLTAGDPIAARAALDAVRQDAEARGFKGLARRAAALQVRPPVSLG
ncbi:MAG TPA: tetratricopeptide repeat protein [Thermoanaerobaculia bacterium]|jgi:DNA-binding winged helix-turn-helix (wHTH) protein/tetratricopeptide (TPR) repeat protein|nr:tetratricopeptide repeat protein [Thermoanaerobaculia bacterium]